MVHMDESWCWKLCIIFVFSNLQNLTRWGGALLELSQFQNFPESKKMTQGAYSLCSKFMSVDFTYIILERKYEGFCLKRFELCLNLWY